MSNNDYDLIIIGGGPAGLSAGIYSARAGYNSVIIEMLGYGGQLMLTDIIDNYPGFPDGISGFELQNRMLKQAERFGIKKIIENVEKIEKKQDQFIITTSNNKYQSISVIIATGAKHRTLDIPGEKELISRGVSYCGTCDGPLFKDKNVVVIGGGDTAFSEAIFLSKFANTVTIIHRRDKFRAVKSLQDQAKKISNINYICNSIPIEIKGKTKVESINIKNIITNETVDKNIDGVFIFIGLIPNSDFINKSLLDNDGYIITDFNMHTGSNGLYAAGDIRSNTFRQIICACSDGACASEYAGKYIDEIKGKKY